MTICCPLLSSPGTICTLDFILNSLWCLSNTQHAESPQRTRVELFGALLICAVCDQTKLWGSHSSFRKTNGDIWDMRPLQYNSMPFTQLESWFHAYPSLQAQKKLQTCACWEYDTCFLLYDPLIYIRCGLKRTSPPSVGGDCFLLANALLLHPVHGKGLCIPWRFCVFTRVSGGYGIPLCRPGYKAAGWTAVILTQASLPGLSWAALPAHTCADRCHMSHVSYFLLSASLWKLHEQRAKVCGSACYRAGTGWGLVALFLVCLKRFIPLKI